MHLSPLAFAAALAAPALHAQDLEPPALPDTQMDQGTGLIEDGARMLLRGLMDELDPAIEDLGALVTEYEPILRELSTLVGNIDDYQMPELLENGDILIRRKPDAPAAEPDLPGAPPLRDVPEPEPETGQIEL